MLKEAKLFLDEQNEPLFRYQRKEGKHPTYMTRADVLPSVRCFDGKRFTVIRHFGWDHLPSIGILHFQFSQYHRNLVPSQNHDHIVAFMLVHNDESDFAQRMIVKFKLDNKKNVIPHQPMRTEKLDRLQELSSELKIGFDDILLNPVAYLKIEGLAEGSPFWCEQELGPFVDFCTGRNLQTMVQPKETRLLLLQRHDYDKSRGRRVLVKLSGSKTNQVITLTNVEWSDILPGWSPETLIKTYAVNLPRSCIIL